MNGPPDRERPSGGGSPTAAQNAWEGVDSAKHTATLIPSSGSRPGHYPSKQAALDDLAVRGLEVGAEVRCERDAPARGSWARHAGRAGRVVTVNLQTFPADRGAYVEVGVSFDNGHNVGAWFLPSELVLQAPQRPVGAANGGGGQ